jgi:hypothetical protein
MYSVVYDREQTYRTVRAGDLGASIAHNHFFKSPMFMAFPIVVDPADRAVGPLSPLPCQAWHGYGVSSAHHGEVRACKRTPLRGRRRCAACGRLRVTIRSRLRHVIMGPPPSYTREERVQSARRRASPTYSHVKKSRACVKHSAPR